MCPDAELKPVICPSFRGTATGPKAKPPWRHVSAECQTASPTAVGKQNVRYLSALYTVYMYRTSQNLQLLAYCEVYTSNPAAGAWADAFPFLIIDIDNRVIFAVCAVACRLTVHDLFIHDQTTVFNSGVCI
jgi:hypothetical protein